MVSDALYKILNMNCSLRSNPSQPPLAPARGVLANTPQLCSNPASNRGGACFTLPLLRGSWRELASNGLSGFNLIIVAVCIALAGCMGADTRGSEAPDHIRISGTPTWTNGIGELMTKKCATCHQVPRLASSPTNVPTDMDLRYEITSGAIRATKDIAAQIKLGILRNALHYGTN